MNDLSGLKITKPPSTLREIALEKMRDAIIGGLFEPGQRLVERTLCEQMGVSRTVIREVIRHLESEGLVDVIANQGPAVARLDWDTARQIYDIRAQLESEAAAACATNIGTADLDALREALEELESESHSDDATSLLKATTDFYRTIFIAAGHGIAWEIVDRLNGRISRLRVLTLSTGDRLNTGPKRMREIYQAIAERKPHEAAAACRTHLQEARKIAHAILTDDSGVEAE
ncbi:MAG: GntR family transcriptional regulator [Hyphomicrobiales bacterium]|nr:GntR family transcriptional regulator [Hyphomicrobiales bacterium]MCP5000108.1 GntR family transcriptional regulator [Hyphomicrobiales bacterium]